MHDMGEWGSSRATVSPERRRYVEHLRSIHDRDGFLKACADETVATTEEVEELLFEAEMLANYDVI